MKYYVIDTYAGDLHGIYDFESDAEETCNRLNRDLPYTTDDCYIYLSEDAYKEFIGETEEPEYDCRKFSIYGICRYADTLPRIEVISATDAEEAIQTYNKMYPNFRVVEVFELGK